MQQVEAIIQDIAALDTAHVEIVNVDEIACAMGLHKAHEENKCDKVEANRSSYPKGEAFKDQGHKTIPYKYGILFQTVHPLRASLDLQGMTEGAAKHNNVFENVVDLLTTKYHIENILSLNGGPCTVCSKCSYKETQFCRFPDRAVASTETYGIDMKQLAQSCNIPYTHGKNTVSYNSLILFDV